MISLRHLTLAAALAPPGLVIAQEPAANVAEPPMAPEARHLDDPVAYDKGSYLGTPWASGGAGDQAREEMMQELADYNLRLEFAVADGNYLSDIAVTVTEAGGGAAVRAFSSGPWFMTKLPAGTYDVRASGFGETFEETVQVPHSGLETVVFNEWTKAGVAQTTPGAGY